MKSEIHRTIRELAVHFERLVDRKEAGDPIQVVEFSSSLAQLLANFVAAEASDVPGALTFSTRLIDARGELRLRLKKEGER